MDLQLTASIKGSYNYSIRYARVVPESTTVPRPCDTVNAAGRQNFPVNSNAP